ncbi:MAG: L-aspartate oxidase, partial [Candidatus Aenigmarchaeota archaeon]|nr:L-aspartate oxidase [Candidatus Aenigmarchaeota archaeon]
MNKTDFVVIGSGIAGLNFALQASKVGKVCLITKRELAESNTNFAQGGIAAVISKMDSFDLHVKDTLSAGDGLCNREAVELMVKNSPEEIERLISCGVGFDSDEGGLELGKEGGHSKNRIVHRGDKTGMVVEKSLSELVKEDGNIDVFEKHMALDLIIKDSKCIGVRVFDEESSNVVDFFAKAVTIATGGIGEIFENTSNPEIATGDGIAMTYRAGCEIEDIEFVQFHPTAMRMKNGPFFLISEAVRGEGAKLLTDRGERFTDELKTRDIVARVILDETKNGKVYIDITHKDPEFLKKRFPKIYDTCKENGIDITKDRIPVEPAAHYSCGGVKTDVYGRTNIKGLFAFGEVACTGVHGANRLASNSLLESLVFSSQTLSAVTEYAKDKEIETVELEKIEVNGADPRMLRDDLKSLMWNNCGMIRTKEGMEKALKQIENIEYELGKITNDKINPKIVELENMIDVSKLIVSAALRREESRGTHFRSDFPAKDHKWERHIALRK